MKFPQVTIGGQSCFLLLLPHDWSQGISVSAQLKASLGEGMTTIESRRPRATTPLHTVKMQLSITGTDCDDYRQNLPFLTTQLIALPVFADMGPPVASSNFIWSQAQYWVCYDDSGNYQILDLATVNSGPTFSYGNLAPLMFGRFKERPKHTIWDKSTILAQLTVVERSPWAFRLGAPAASPVWTADPDYAKEPEEISELSTKFSGIGFSREDSIEFQDAAPRWRQTAGFTFCSKAEIAQHLAFFMQQRGEVMSWSPIPAWCTPGADTAADPANLTVRFASDTIELKFQGVDGWVASADVGFIQEIAIAGGGPANFTDSGGNTLTDSAGRNITDADGAPDGQQNSNTMALICRLTYQCSPWLPNYVERYADWDAPLTIGAETFNPWPMSLKSWKSSIDLQNSEIEVDWAFAADTILAYWIREWSDFPILVELYYTNPDNLSAPLIPVSSARVSSVDPTGSIVTFKADPLNGALTRKIPGWLFQSSCNATWGDVNCGVVKSSFETIGTLVLGSGLSSDGMTLTVTGVSGWKGIGSPSDWTQGMFAYGFLVLDGTNPSGGTVAGNLVQRLPVLRQIANSSTAAGVLTLTLAQSLTSDRLAAGSYKVLLFPGCSGQNGYVDPASIVSGNLPTPIATPPPCTCAFFGNYANFGGFPFIPYYVSQTVIGSPKVGK